MGRDAYLGADNIDTIDFGEPTIRFVRPGKQPLGRNVDLPASNWMRLRNSQVSVGFDAPKFGADSRGRLCSPRRLAVTRCAFTLGKRTSVYPSEAYRELIKTEDD